VDIPTEILLQTALVSEWLARFSALEPEFIKAGVKIMNNITKETT
jgi:hypothetical protein